MPFAELYHSLFPSISDSICRDLRKYLDRNPNLESWLYAPTSFQHLAQGDIIKALPACSINESGDTISTKNTLPALLLSNTCDMSIESTVPRKKMYTIIPLLPFCETNYDNDLLRSIKDNTVTDILYLPQIPHLKGSYIAQLDLACSISSKYVHQQPNACRVSLSRDGFYYFMAKISMHLTRPENDLSRHSTEIHTNQ